MDSVDAAEDWLPEQPRLRSLEQHLRCQICYELFTAPVLLVTCGHVFCSECIRDALESSKRECPACHKPATDAHIRTVPLLEDLVKDWTSTRPGLLALVKFGTRASTPTVSIGMKRKASSDNGPKGKARALEHDSSLEIIEEDTEAPCPVCSKVLPIRQIPTHIDRNCKDTNVSGWNKMFGSTSIAKTKPGARLDKPLPKENFSNTKQAKEWLKDHDLPTDGSREVLYKRVDDWIMLVNANLNRTDMSTRQSPADLRKKLLQREAQRLKGKAEVDDGHQAHYGTSFKELTAQIQARTNGRHGATERVTSPVIDLDAVEAQESSHLDGEGSSTPSSPAAASVYEGLRASGPEDSFEYDLTGMDDMDDEPHEAVGPLDPLPVYNPPRPPYRSPSPFTGAPPPPSQRPRSHIVVI